MLQSTATDCRGSMLEIVTENFWNIAASIMVVAFSGYVAWRSSYKSRYANACSAFRSSVLTTLNGLYPHQASWPSDSSAIDPILRAAFPALQAAVAEFRPFLPWWRRSAFDRAWFQYHCSTGRSIDAQVYHHYMAFSSQPDPKETFNANVARLLSFAKAT